jgi:hypothetical protein
MEIVLTFLKQANIAISPLGLSSKRNSQSSCMEYSQLEGTMSFGIFLSYQAETRLFHAVPVST